MTRGLRMLALAAGLAVAVGVGGCGDVGGAGTGPDRVVPSSDADAVAPPTPPRGHPAVLAVDAVSVAPPAEFDRYPALAAAVTAAADVARGRFEDDARAAAVRGEDVGDWALRIEWRVLRGNRYLWLAEGEGQATRGAGQVVPVHLRLVYDGIGKQVLGFGDWFAVGAWPEVVEMLRGRVPADADAPSPDAWRTLAYEPIHRPEGQVMRFDLLLPPADGGGPLRIPVPREAVDAWIADDRRILLDATAAGM